MALLPKKIKNSQLLTILTPEVKKIFSIFGDEIRLVGGAVRNLIIDLEINDFDFATKLIPNKVKQKLQQNNIKYTDLAEKFGTIIAIVNKKNFEITTLRKDYQNDGRH